MPNSWLDVPYVFCHLRLQVSHQLRKKNPADGPNANVYAHSAEYVVAGTFRLQRADGGRNPYFVNKQVTLQVSGWGTFVTLSGSGEDADEMGRRAAFSGRTAPGGVTLELSADNQYFATFQSSDMPAFKIKLSVKQWIRGGGSSQEGEDEEEGEVSFLLQQPFPAQPGEVSFQARPTSILVSTPFCPGPSACEDPQISGTLRLTPGLPAFRIVDDTVDQNPIPHCRVRVLCPDGVTREFLADEAGEVFIPRSGQDVHTLVEVLHDSAPLSASEPGPWNVDVTSDLP